MNDYIFYTTPVPQKKKELVEKINHLMEIPSQDLYIVIDGNDHDNYINPTYSKNEAFHMNIKKGGIEEMSPPYILTIMEKPDCEHLVWVSKKVINSEDIRFAWIYSHELQHLKQDIRDHPLSVIGHFLSITFGHINPKKKVYWPQIPTEFEAEKTAKEIVSKIFGKETSESYIKRECLLPERKKYFDKFFEIESRWPFDVKRETISILCEYKEQFKKLQQEAKEDGENFNFNIDVLCAEYSGI